ncbi:unnamed protein product, partial [Hydatigera taeniaeformis]|uniref:Secreted protein n=1 Tax=Hydatigena taeniaeformis TaxID=6205 RepID=A0A0R3WY61_HYDTA
VKKVTLTGVPTRPISWFGLVCFIVLVLSLVSKGEAQLARSRVEEILPTKNAPSESRKQIFRNVKEFRRYLQRLDEWLAITGLDENVEIYALKAGQSVLFDHAVLCIKHYQYKDRYNCHLSLTTTTTREEEEEEEEKVGFGQEKSLRFPCDLAMRDPEVRHRYIKM